MHWKRCVKSHRNNESECPMSSCACSKTGEHVIPKKTYRRDSASVISLCLSSFLRLSVSLWLRHFIFNDRNESSIQEKRNLYCKQHSEKVAVFVLSETYMRIVDSEDSLVYLKQWYTSMRNPAYLEVFGSSSTR